MGIFEEYFTSHWVERLAPFYPDLYNDTQEDRLYFVLNNLNFHLSERLIVAEMYPYKFELTPSNPAFHYVYTYLRGVKS